MLGTIFGSCQKVLDIDDTGANDLLVLNGVPSAGKQPFVFFSHTHFFLDDVAAHPVDGTSMTLTINGVPYAPDSIVNCKYFFPYVMQPYDSLRVDVVTPETTVHAETYVPPFPDVTSFSVVEYASPSWNFYLANFHLNDHGGFPEYYNLTVTVRDSGVRYNPWTEAFDTVDTVHSTYFLLPGSREITSNEVSPNLALGGYLYSGLMCTDRLIDGQNYPVSMYILLLKDTNEVEPFKHTYTFMAESITLERMRYLVSVAQTTSTITFFAEQAQPYGNVDGALGVFAGNARRSFEFDPDTIPHVSAKPAEVPDEALELLKRRSHKKL